MNFENKRKYTKNLEVHNEKLAYYLNLDLKQEIMLHVEYEEEEEEVVISYMYDNGKGEEWDEFIDYGVDYNEYVDRYKKLDEIKVDLKWVMINLVNWEE